MTYQEKSLHNTAGNCAETRIENAELPRCSERSRDAHWARAPQAAASLDRSPALRDHRKVVGAKGAADNFDRASGGSNEGRR